MKRNPDPTKRRSGRSGVILLSILLVLALLGAFLAFILPALRGENAGERIASAASDEADVSVTAPESEEQTGGRPDLALDSKSRKASEPAKTPGTESEPIRLLALKGPTAMGAAAWIQNVRRDGDPAYGVPVQATVLAAPDLLPPLIAKGEYEMALMPTSLAAVLNKKTNDGLRFMALSTMSVLHICERGDTVHRLSDLRGRTIVLSGKGTTPDQILLNVLHSAGLSSDELSLEYVSEHQAVVQRLAADPTLVALLPEPFVTVTGTKLPDLRVAIDLNDAWKESHQSGDEASAIVQGVLVARRDWLEANPELAAKALNAFQTSTAIAQETPELAAEAIASLDLFPREVAVKALPRCGLTSVSDEKAKQLLRAFLSQLDDEKTPDLSPSFFENGFTP